MTVAPQDRPPLTPECVANLAAASGIDIAPERLPAVVAVLSELFALEHELEGVVPSEVTSGSGVPERRES